MTTLRGFQARLRDAAAVRDDVDRRELHVAHGDAEVLPVARGEVLEEEVELTKSFR